MTNLRRHSCDPAPMGSGGGGADARLSRAGADRREQLLGQLHAELDQRVARRRVTRTAGGVLACVVVLTAVWAWMPSGPGPSVLEPSPIVGADPAPAPIPAPAPAPMQAATLPDVITIVKTDPDIVRRLAVAPAPSSIEVISDFALQTELAAAGIDPGLVTINGRTITALAGDTSLSPSR